MRAIGIMKTTVTTMTGDTGKFHARFNRARLRFGRASALALA
jgi:hypothetical protein